MAQTQNKFLYIFEIQFKNGAKKHPVMINSLDPDYKQQIKDAKDYFSNRYKYEAIIEIILVEDINSAGISFPELLKPWKEYLDFIYKNINPKTALFLQKLRILNFSPYLLGILEWDLSEKENEEHFRISVLEKLSDQKEVKNLFNILNLIKEAHKGQNQVRDKDAENGNTNLNHISYANHPIQIANISFEKDLSLNAIKTALLHDVIEDTPINASELRKNDIDEAVIEMVMHLSRDKSVESREEFMERVASLTGEVLILKCLDRFHNIMRSFGSIDSKYLDRYIKESRINFLPIFKTQPLLLDMSQLFEDLLLDLEKYKKILESR